MYSGLSDDTGGRGGSHSMVSVEHVRVGLRTPAATREQRGSDENATALRWPALVVCAQINNFALQLLSTQQRGTRGSTMTIHHSDRTSPSSHTRWSKLINHPCMAAHSSSQLTTTTSRDSHRMTLVTDTIYCMSSEHADAMTVSCFTRSSWLHDKSLVASVERSD